MLYLQFSIFAFLLFSLAGCLHPQLRVRNEAFSALSLPCGQLKTPSLGSKDSMRGEQFTVHWCLPKGHWQNAILTVQWRLVDATVRKFNYPLVSKKSCWQRSLSGPEFRNSGGIASYCVKIERNGSLIAQRVHPMWMKPVPIFVNQRG